MMELKGPPFKQKKVTIRVSNITSQISILGQNGTITMEAQNDTEQNPNLLLYF